MDVERWAPVGQRWYEHRAEPLLRERLWGAAVALDMAYVEDGVAFEAGFDADDVCVAWRQLVQGAETCREEVLERRPGLVVVSISDGGRAETEVDASGRPTRTTYSGRTEAVELYGYDADGRLATIEEPRELELYLSFGSERLDTGGRLTVDHDENGPVRITDPHGSAVWERPELPWPQRLAAGAAAIADGCRRLIAEEAERSGPIGHPEAYGLALVYVDQGSLRPIVSVGLEADRREFAEGGGDVEELALMTMYPEGDSVGFIDDAPISDALDTTLLREACMAEPGDPYRLVLGAAAELLARGEIPPLKRTTDFVVWMAEHDEGFEEKIDAIRRHNPPDAVARWEAGWGSAVLEAVRLESEW